MYALNCMQRYCKPGDLPHFLTLLFAGGRKERNAAWKAVFFPHAEKLARGIFFNRGVFYETKIGYFLGFDDGDDECSWLFGM